MNNLENLKISKHAFWSKTNIDQNFSSPHFLTTLYQQIPPRREKMRLPESVTNGCKSENYEKWRPLTGSGRKGKGEAFQDFTQRVSDYGYVAATLVLPSCVPWHQSSWYICRGGGGCKHWFRFRLPCVVCHPFWGVRLKEGNVLAIPLRLRTSNIVCGCSRNLRNGGWFSVKQGSYFQRLWDPFGKAKQFKK